MTRQNQRRLRDLLKRDILKLYFSHFSKNEKQNFWRNQFFLGFQQISCVSLNFDTKLKGKTVFQNRIVLVTSLGEKNERITSEGEYFSNFADFYT